MPDLDAVLFDLGGVLTSDPWEALLLSPGVGLADRFCLDRKTVKRVGEELWGEYCTRPADKREYWTELSSRLRVEISLALVDLLEAELIVANPQMRPLLTALGDKGISLGIVSETTSFWYPTQISLFGSGNMFHERLRFLSYQHGVRKDVNQGGLFEIAARQVNPSRTLVVDDRSENAERARTYGFQALDYTMGAELDIAADISERIL